jgi:hypothetical protein
VDDKPRHPRLGDGVDEAFQRRPFFLIVDPDP